MNFNKEYDTEYLNKVIEYNKERYYSYVNEIPFEYNIEYEKVLNARYHKNARIKRRLIYLLTRCDYIWFCTFTFSDLYINKSDRTKRDLIKSVLKNYDFKYILNVDYGKITEREHYHCILGTDFNIDIDKLFKEKYPCFSLSIQCKKGFNDLQRLSKYINKLTNHCIKATTKRQRIVYNFKGYDTFCPTTKDKNFAFFQDINILLNVPLLDKGDITGKI